MRESKRIYFGLSCISERRMATLFFSRAAKHTNADVSTRKGNNGWILRDTRGYACTHLLGAPTWALGLIAFGFAGYTRAWD